MENHFDFTIQDGFKSIRETLAKLRDELQVDLPTAAATGTPLHCLADAIVFCFVSQTEILHCSHFLIFSLPVHPLFALNILEQKNVIDKSLKRIRSRLDQWRSWCAAEEDPEEKQKNLKRTTTWLRDRAGDSSKISNIKKALNGCQQQAMAYLETRGATFASLQAPVCFFEPFASCLFAFLTSPPPRALRTRKRTNETLSTRCKWLYRVFPVLVGIRELRIMKIRDRGCT